MRRMDDIIARCLAQRARPAAGARLQARAALQEPR
jgi:hypothetical protein